jgi:hypothetical protein
VECMAAAWTGTTPIRATLTEALVDVDRRQ